MDSTRGGRSDIKGQTRQPIYEAYQPSTVWSQDAENHLLRVLLPGFKKEELNVQITSSGKLTVKGMRQVGEGRYMRLDHALDVPKDSIIDKISGKFEDGCLHLIMPKKVVEAKEAPQKGALPQEIKEEEHPIQREKPKGGEGKKEEDPIPKEKTEKGEEKKKKDDPIPKERTEKSEEKKKDDDPIPKERTEKGEEKKKEDDPIPKEKTKKGKEKKTEDDEPAKKFEDDASNKVGKARKEGVVGKKRGKDEEEGWLDYGLVDNLLEKINRNRKVIAVAFVAFAVGFYVSRKLRSSGR